MPDFKDLLQALNQIYGMIFGSQIPSWLPRLTAILVLIAICLFAVWGLLLLISKIMSIWKEQFRPLLYSEDDKHLTLRRQRFAEHIDYEIRRINRLEEWSDHKFAELEAEVEAEGAWQPNALFGGLGRWQAGLRKEKSLSRALETSRERLILLEGEPGSGKSVALRHLTTGISQRAAHSKSKNSLIPIYINLKELERRDGETIDRKLIYDFVIRFLNRANDRDIEEYLDQQFDKGLQAGSWLFLFDSFDEIPELLSATEADKATREYAEAISDFLHGMNSCRGVVASRAFRGPAQSGWPKFRILALSEDRKRHLVTIADLGKQRTVQVLGDLEYARDEIKSMASNPMFLGLLCEHIRQGLPFPENTHAVFESYITSRLERDSGRLSRKFGIAPKELRAAAEDIAFCMATDDRLGLSPARHQIKLVLNKLGMASRGDFDISMDALEYLKLARSEAAAGFAEDRIFTFSHRRFQEYFATCVVLHEPGRVSARQLLTDGRWRETTVTLFQTQPSSKVEFILVEAEKLIVQASRSLDLGSRSTKAEANGRMPFPWPINLLYTLELLEAGLAGRRTEVPSRIISIVEEIISCASMTGTQFDRRVSIELGGLVKEESLSQLIELAFRETSLWLRDAAYQQVSRLQRISPAVLREIQKNIFWSVVGEGRRNRPSMYAYLSRVALNRRLIRTYEVIFYAWLVVRLLLFAALALLIAVEFSSHPDIALAMLSLGALGLIGAFGTPMISRGGSFGRHDSTDVVSVLFVGYAYIASWIPVIGNAPATRLSLYAASVPGIAGVWFMSIYALAVSGMDLSSLLVWATAPAYLLVVVLRRIALRIRAVTGANIWRATVRPLIHPRTLRLLIKPLAIALLIPIVIPILMALSILMGPLIMADIVLGAPGLYLLMSREHRLARTWIANQTPRTLCLQDVVDEMNRYYLPSGCLEVLVAVRNRNLLKAAADEVPTLNVMIAGMEREAAAHRGNELNDNLRLRPITRVVSALRSPRLVRCNATEWPEHLPDLFFGTGFVGVLSNRRASRAVIDELCTLLSTVTRYA